MTHCSLLQSTLTTIAAEFDRENLYKSMRVAEADFEKPDYALSSAIKAWHKTGTYELFLRV
jgi:hypothetical protein